MFTFESAAADHASIHVQDWPLDNPRAVVIIAHGAAEHAVRYARAAAALNEAGYAVLAPDHRGHGLTGQAATLGVFAAEDGWNKSVADLSQLVSIARGRYPGKPVVLMGHSMGSFMTQQFIGEYGDQIDAAVLSGSTILAGFAELVEPLAEECRTLGRDQASPLMTQMMGSGMGAEFDDGDTGFEWLSRDADEVRKYIDDPLCGFGLSSGAWYDMIGNNRVPMTPDGFSNTQKSLPLYLFAGDKDPVNGNLEGLHALVGLYQAAGFTDVETKYYTDARHEMLNETNRDEVTADLIAWLDQHV